MTDKNVRDELAELTEAVRELRDREVADELRSLRAEVEKLRADRAGHHCHGCSCTHVHWYTYPNYVTTCGGGTIAASTTNVAAGVGSTYMVSLASSNS